MAPGDIEKVKAEMARLTDMVTRLEAVTSENEDAKAALDDGVDHLRASLVDLQEAVHYADGTITPLEMGDAIGPDDEVRDEVAEDFPVESGE